MIYFIEAQGVGNIKIGFTDQDDAAYRLAQLQTGSPVPLRLLGTISGTMETEKDLHRRFASAKVCGEWFKPIEELIALIPLSEPLRNDTVEVVEKTVSIRVMTVGRKQFTKGLVNQLPHGCPFDDFSLWEAIDNEWPVDFLFRDDCSYWGWLDLGVVNEFWVIAFIYEEDGVLCNSRIFDREVPVALLHDISWVPQEKPEEYKARMRRKDHNEKIKTLWRQHRHKWISHEHHLYFGV